MKFYSKNTCVTCKKAKAYLEKKKVAFQEIDIVSTPPEKAVLEKLLTDYEKAGNLKATINTRSAAYKEHLAGKPLPDKASLLKLMLKDANLIKRPVIINAKGTMQLGFDETEYNQFLK